MKYIWLVIGFAAFLAIAALSYSLLKDKAQVQQVELEEKWEALDFTVTDEQGDTLKISDKFGKPLVINFWASWCTNCVDEMPVFEQFYNDLNGEVEFMMINLTDGERETVEKARSFIENTGFTFPVYYDKDLKGYNLYGISFIPATLFIDKDGYILAGVQGALNEEVMQKGIELIHK